MKLVQRAKFLSLKFSENLQAYVQEKVVFILRDEGLLLEKPREDVIKVFKEIAESGKSVKIKPDEYVEELEKRFK